MTEIIIDPDFRDFFPPLDADVYEGLKDKIRYEGFTDPLKLVINKIKQMDIAYAKARQKAGAS